GGLPADFPAWPGGERIGLRRRLGERRGGDRKEKHHACEDRFQAATPLRCRTCACSSSWFDQPSILRHVPDGVPRLSESLAQEREIVMTVREARITVQRPFVRFH